MKRYIFSILLPFLIASAAAITISCIHEPEGFSVYGEGEVIDLAIPFGAPKGTGVTVSTKSALSLSDESHVFNIYLLIFDGNISSSKLLYGHYFDGSNMGASSESNWWEVSNMSSTGDPSATTGTLHIRTAKKGGCTVVAVANMNPDDLDVSPGVLSTIRTYGDLNNVVATQVRSEIAANSGYFLMTGQITGVDILGDTTDPNDISQNTLHLRRLYAKVSFEVQISTAGAAAGIRKFVPDKWYVVNVPTCSYLMERSLSGSLLPYDAAQTLSSDPSSSQFFSTPELGFETEKLAKDPANPSNYVYYHDGVTKASCHGFSFYMMENRKAPYARPGDAALPSPFNYADREREIKVAGLNQGFRYADERSTYIVMTGKIVMGVTSGSNANATLDANVKYKIHLGDFGTDNADFNILRNHNYLYKIYINGSDDIKAEVVDHVENEPGATGRVIVAEEEVFDSDCHYSTQVISFHADLINPSQISWYVETPFNPEGAGPNDGLELSDIDYKWVEFHVNEMKGDGTYSQNRVLYQPHDWPKYDEMGIAPGTKGHTMYVNELVEYIKHQKSQYDLHAADDSLPESDFDHDPEGPKISVTAFVNEYYYEEHPTKGGFDPTLWKLVVNHPMRRMHILASSSRSDDRESDLIGASFTLQQRSIQSIYAVHEAADLQSAWGMEFTDDEWETGAATYWKDKAFEDCGNTSTTNGRINSLKIWGILTPEGELNGAYPRWDDYLELTGTNETPHLRTEYNYLRYSCLSRNRDNDGDGIIDPEEIRWYMASDVQLIGVFLGSYGIEGDARLYQRNAEQQASNTNEVWRQHIISSNRYAFNYGTVPDDALNSNKYARVIWAEEGVNGSNLSYTSTGATAKFSTRCVRNLGYYMDGGQRKDITQATDHEVEPNPYVIMTRKHLNADGTVTSPYTEAYDTRTFYEFDCSHINLTSLREPVNHELIGHDENSKMACLSSKFETAPEINLVNLNNYTAYNFNGKPYNLKVISQINDYLDASFGGLDANFSPCPAGFRLPNVRELSVIWNVLSPLTSGDATFLAPEGSTMPCRTHWSMRAKVSGKWGWGMDEKHMLMAETTNSSKNTSPRCVRDVQ
ncbi:MAG: DUF4906 domain-containing protein [Bacteroidales bacterium]|nr:DUF4906 domain-containing protein [Bacteroidales bacterium]